MKKKIGMAFILGMVVSSMMNVIASNTIPANSVIYGDKTVDVALNNLYDDVTLLENGKNKIAEAITNNGVATDTTLSFDDIATNINALATNKYNAGVDAADNRANANSVNYKTGYNAGVTATKKGTATAAQVLTGYTFTNNGGVAISGTMANKGALNWKPTTSTTYTVPAGYYSGGTLDSSTVYTNGYNAGVTAADNRANTNSVNYKTGYNAGYSAGSSSTGKYHLGLFGIKDGASTAGSILTSFKVIDTTYFTNNNGKIICQKAGNYVIFGDGYFNYYYAYVYNSSGSQKASYLLLNQRYNQVSLNVGDYIQFVETDTVSGNMHRNVGIFSL